MSPMALEYGIRLLFLFILGSIFGSWLNVCIYRLAVTEEFWPALYSLLYPPSRCPGCLQPIPFYDNIPILGWLKLRGRCRNCRMWIPPRYMLIEFLTATLFVLLYCHEIPYSWGGGSWSGGITHSGVYHPYGPQGIEYTWMSPDVVQHLRYAFHLVLVLGLIVATFIDFDHQIIPDSVTLPAMTIGILGNWLLGCVHLVPVWYQETGRGKYLDAYRYTLEQIFSRQALPDWLVYILNFQGLPAWFAQWPHLHGLLVSLAGLVVGGGLIWGIRIIGYWVLRREAMGFGDVVLMAMIGSFIGWQPALIVFFFSPLCAIVVAGLSWILWRKTEIPYGPYISVATLITLFGWPRIWPATEERIFGLGPFLPIVALLMFCMLALLLQATRGVRRLLGIPDADDSEMVWESADQLLYQAGERPTQTEGQWPAPHTWRGIQAGRGLQPTLDWRHPPAPTPRPWQHLKNPPR